MYFTGLTVLLLLMWLLNISLGSVNIPFKETFRFLTFQSLENDTWQTILYNLRLPKSITAILVGMGLSMVGLMMQTLFRNPMAGPSVLGISSGASLGVALLVMGSGFLGISVQGGFGFKMGIVLSAVLGSLAVLVLILLLSYRIKNTISILIIGLMLSALTSSIVSILSYFSTAQKLQQYLFWGFGNLNHLTYGELLFLSLVLISGIVFSMVLLKPMNGLLMGENFAKSQGINILKTQNYLLLLSGLLTGILTAYTGPIAFVGLAVPHLARLLFKTSQHKILFPAVLLIGSIVMLVCDTLAQLPFNEKVIPINAVTSLFGAPLVIFLILKHKSYRI